jgi:hypothetical protein
MIYDEKKDEMKKVGLSWVACCEANDLLCLLSRWCVF